MEWLQEHYNGQTVLCAEKDVLTQVLTSDLREESTAAQRMRTLQGQLRAACQQGMPAWLLDVHSHNVLESHLSKGSHEECFNVFLSRTHTPSGCMIRKQTLKTMLPSHQCLRAMKS
ncbi:TPA: hypothetical protein ACH3X2_007525 [Trebouxia sp. C0005]